MNPLLRESLDRTFLLARDDVTEKATDLHLLGALTGTIVALVSDEMNLATPAAQSALVTTALLMARSGHRVHLIVPNVPLSSPHPPLKATGLLDGLVDIGLDLLPSIEFSTDPPHGPVDLCVTVGDSATCIQARHSVSMNASAWAGRLDRPATAKRWEEPAWPLGAFVAAALAAAEAFKLAMYKLRSFARRPRFFAKLFALNHEAHFELAPADTPTTAELGLLDFVSGGAITHASLYCLLLLPNVRGIARVIENTTSDHSNLNRYALQRRSDLFAFKTETLRRFSIDNLRITTENVRLEASTFASLMPLAPRVLVGVDHIPTRWFVQESDPKWLAIGASTHWNAMASFHVEGLACARCLHPEDDDNDAPIPTVAFVSFWVGLLQVAYLLRDLAGAPGTAHDQHIFLTPLRPEAPWRGAVIVKPECPICRESKIA